MKSFPYELRGWETKNFEGIDITDSYGSEIQIYINRRRILLIEPSYEAFTLNNWLSDKGRHVFDSLYKTQGKLNNLTSNICANIYHRVIKRCYFLEHFFNSLSVKNFLTVVFGQIGVETLSFLKSLTQRYSFINLKSITNSGCVDFETTFQLNAVSNYTKLKFSDLCLLVGTNSRFESFRLNLMLRQRVLKGGFTCILFSSLIDLTFTTFFKTPSVSNIHSIYEGTHILCQELTEAENPLIIYNSELLKNNHGESTLKALQALSNYSVNGFQQSRMNMINSTLCEAGVYTLTKIDSFSFKDLLTSSMLYFVQNNTTCESSIVQASEMNILNASCRKKLSSAFIVDQNCFYENNTKFNLSKDFYYFLPSSTFYENDESYFNTEGFFKRTTKLVASRNVLSTWQTFLLTLKYLNKHIQPLNFKSSNNLTYAVKSYFNFKNYTHLNFYSTKCLSTLNYYLLTKTAPTVLINYLKFKLPAVKVKYSKFKLWLEDFFTGGADCYTRHSEVLVVCSTLLRVVSRNF